MDPQVVDPRHSIVIHAVNEPGSLIGWSAMVEPYLCRATATALESTRMVAFDREFVEAYCQRRPRFGLEFMKRILWALGDRIRTSRAQLATRRYSREAQRVRELLARRGEKLGVNSPLYKLPIYLENRLTAADAYDTLDEVALSPNPLESGLAVECRRLIASAERRSARVPATATDLRHCRPRAPGSASPHEIRRICCRAFQKLYALTSYRIRGWENLPDGPGNVILMNHLSNHVENTLPNRFQLTLDTHFVSAMILFERYGEPPVRVVRQAEPDEAGHRRYFNRFGYITVTSSRPRGPAEEVDRQLRGRARAVPAGCAARAGGGAQSGDLSGGRIHEDAVFADGVSCGRIPDRPRREPGTAAGSDRSGELRQADRQNPSRCKDLSAHPTV